MGWGIPWEFFPFVLGWLVKVLVVRYGGLHLYRPTAQAAIGLIVGHVLNAACWSVITAVTG